MAKGEAKVDFGLGASEASVAVTGQTSILATSYVEAFIMEASTTDHSADEHNSEEFIITCGSLVETTGFTIYVRCRQGTAHGQFKIKWVWS
jgi:hypothetical protein